MLTASFIAAGGRYLSSFPSKRFEIAPAVNLFHVGARVFDVEEAFASGRMDGPGKGCVPIMYDAAFPLPGLEAGMRLAMTEVERGMI